MSEIQYAKAGDTHIAYSVVEGSGGEHEIAMIPGWFFPIEVFPDDPVTNRMVEGLASLGRLCMFDRRGIGLSDPVASWDPPIVEQWADDLLAVLDAAGFERPTIFSWCPNPVGPIFALRHPDRLSRLALFEPSMLTTAEDRALADGFDAAMRANRAGEGDLMERSFSTRFSDPAFRGWLDRAGRSGASPAQFDRLYDEAQKSNELMTDAMWAEITVPTLVVVRPDTTVRIATSESAHRVASLVVDGSVVDVPGVDATAIGGEVDALVAEISAFVTGEYRAPPPERLLTAILFTDIVDSTARAATLGDERWKTVLDRHDETVRISVGRSGGTVVKSTGDGVLALLPTATAALRAADDLIEGLHAADLHVRVGLHLGEVDRRGDDISGLAVHVAARVMAVAQGDEIMVSDVVRTVADDHCFTFEDRGAHQLKGIDGRRRLYAASSLEPTSPPPRVAH